MDGINLGWTIVVGVPVLALHLVSVTMTKALRTYSRSLLEDLCERRGHPGRADDVDHEDEKVTRKADDADGKRVYAVRITGKVSRGNRGCHSRGPVFHTDIYKYHSAFTNADGFAGTTFTAAREDFEWWVTYGGSSSSHHIFRTADFRALHVGGSS